MILFQYQARSTILISISNFDEIKIQAIGIFNG